MIFETGIPLVLFLLGWFIGHKLFHVSGKLIINETDPETDKWLFELSDPIDSISKRKTIKLKVERRQHGGGIET